MKSFLYVGLLLLTAPAWATCATELVASPNLTIDPHLVGRLESVKLSREEFLALLEAPEALYHPDDHPSGVVVQILTRSPKDRVVYETRAIADQIVGARIELRRIVDFRRADAHDQANLERDKAEELRILGDSKIPDWLRDIMNVVDESRAEQRDAPVGPVNENDEMVRLKPRKGAYAGKTFLGDDTFLRLKLAVMRAGFEDLLAMLERDEIGGRPLDRDMAYALRWPFVQDRYVLVGRLGAFHLVVVYRKLSETSFEIITTGVRGVPALEAYRAD